MTANEAADEWPRIDKAIGCLDCERVFLRPKPLTLKTCPHCGSESTYDMTTRQDGHVALQLVTMVAKLDEVLNG